MPTLFLLGLVNVTTVGIVCSEDDPRFCSMLDTGGLPVVAFVGLIPFVSGLFGVTMLRDLQTLARLNWIVFVLAGVLLTFTWIGTIGFVGIVFGLVWALTGLVALRTIHNRSRASAPASAGS
jgi:hypothetical protein